MIKAVELTSEKEEFVSYFETEIINVVSERNLLSEFKSLTYCKAKELKNKLEEILKNNSKNFKYKIFMIADEDRNNVNVKKCIVYLDTEENLYYVMNSLTEKFVKLDLFNEEPVQKTVTALEQLCQFWCDEIQKYLTHTFNFKGTTKINASGINGNIESFNITVSGKGTNDIIVNGLKKIHMNNEKLYCYNDDDIFALLNNIFES